MTATEPRGSYCTTASCLPHRRRVFVQLWPHQDGTPCAWVHTDLSPCPGLPPQDEDAVLVPADRDRWGNCWNLPRLTVAEMAGAT
jgi:hypothetical protein